MPDLYPGHCAGSASVAPILTSAGYVLHMLVQIGLRVILTMTNFYGEYGGISFYVDSTLGSGYQSDVFYYESLPLAAYRKWVRLA